MMWKEEIRNDMEARIKSEVANIKVLPLYRWANKGLQSRDVLEQELNT